MSITTLRRLPMTCSIVCDIMLTEITTVYTCTVPSTRDSRTSMPVSGANRICVAGAGVLIACGMCDCVGRE